LEREAKKKKAIMKYKYVGDGAGVPGLPHEISDEEAESLGITELLKAAVENGSYVEDQLSAVSNQRSSKSKKQPERPPVVIEDKPWLDEPKEDED
jgi:hypothetical protein